MTPAAAGSPAKTIERRGDADPASGDETGQALRRADARLRILMAAAATAASRATLLEACRSIGQVLCDYLDCNFLGIWMLPVGTWVLRCADSWSRPGSGLEAFQVGAAAAALAPGVGLPGKAWATCNVQWFAEDEIDNAAFRTSHPHTILPPSAIAAGLRGGVAVPVRCGEDVLAVIEILGATKHPFDQVLADMLDTVGVQVALTELRSRAELRSELAQKELEEAREQLEAVMTCAPAFIATIGRDDTIHFLNRLWPYLDHHQTMGASWKNFVETAKQAPMASDLAKVFALGTHQSHEIAIKGLDGRTHWLSNHLGPIGIGGQIEAAVVVSQDVTDAKLAEIELAGTQRLTTLGTLAAGVAHEINTPVQFVSDSVHFLQEAATGVLSLVDTLKVLPRLVLDDASPAQQREAAIAALAAVEAVDLDYTRENMPKAFERALSGLERVAGIVRSMKEFAHPAQTEMAAVDLNRAIQSTLTVATSEYKHIADLETQLGALPPVVCYLNDINQVVLNIVVNAAHAIADAAQGSGQRGTIKVTSAQVGGHAVISISDTGVGIPDSIRDRIYDPFFTTKEVGRGSGQGLAIARAIIKDKHGGDLSFETKVGVGTTFFIWLPIAGKTRP
jgi:signal transduction histidine kinase